MTLFSFKVINRSSDAEVSMTIRTAEQRAAYSETHFNQQEVQWKYIKLFLSLLHFLLPPSSVSDRRSWLVLSPDPQWTGRPVGAAGGGPGEAEGRVWASEMFAGQAGGGAEEVEAAGQRSGGLHWHAAGAHHGAEAHSPASALQVKVTKGGKGFAVQSASVHSNLHNSSLVFSLLCCPFWYKYLGTERCWGDVFQTACFTVLKRVLVEGFGSGGSECRESSGCFQVHTASWV